MKKLFLSAALLGLASFAGAQQVKLLEDIPADQGAPEGQAGDTPQIIMPSEEKPAEAPAPQAVPAGDKTPAPARKAAAKKPAKDKAAAKKPAAKPAAAVPAPAKAAEPAAVKPAGSEPAVQAPAEKKQTPPAAAKPAEKAAEAKPVPAAKPAEKAPEVKPAAAKPAEKPAAKPAPAAAKPAPVAAKPAAAKPAAKPAEMKPAAAKPEEAKPSGKAGFSVGKTHVVTGGDTLWDLSGKYYKDPYKWGKIYNANLGIVSNPDRIYPREELVIPDITEEIKPEVKKPFVIGESETVKEADFSGSEVAQLESADAAAPAAAPVPAAPAAPARTAKAELSELESVFDRTDLSEEMPEHQKEWASGVKIVPDSWKEDGVITAKEKGDDDSMEDSLSSGGETLSLSMDRAGLVKPGDRLYVYLKGSDAYDKAGNRLGREIQPAGILEVTETDGSGARARVVDAVTGIAKGYVVKKK